MDRIRGGFGVSTGCGGRGRGAVKFAIGRKRAPGGYASVLTNVRVNANTGFRTGREAIAVLFARMVLW